MEREKIIKIIKSVISQNNIDKAYLFGSFARNEKYNDIDIAFEKPEKFSLLDLSRVANILEEKLGIHVDMITVKSIHPKLRSIIESEMVEI
jgi:predicted nucleotidyltransferase